MASKLPLFKSQIIPKDKPVSIHPWNKTIKDKYFHKINLSHNSIHNPRFPSNEKDSAKKRIKFTVIGNRCKKEFIYCVRLLQGICKYRSTEFEPPVIRGVTGLEWQSVWEDLKLVYGGLAFCLLSQVAVIIDGRILGGDKELKELIESKYIYYLCLDYYKEAVYEFARFVNLTGRPSCYMQIMIDAEEIGTMIFMLYSDVVPRTCENFLRLCSTTRGGYGGSPIHRIVKDGWIQGGGFRLNSSDLNCENFALPHDKRGILCMANDGRDIDCSTQFFILLQPAPWMDQKYVAFGQLIDGTNVLDKIENEPCFYESPIKNITIYKAGILNLECHDFIINKHTKHYINKHIDDLVTAGEIFYELLLHRVFLEIEFRQVARMEIQREGEQTDEKKATVKMRDSKRFIRKHADQKSVGESESQDDNQDFDVEDYIPEEYSYQTTGTAPATDDNVVVKPTKPFYLPLTDVPFPGEKDSTYDLKKFLRGDYCHESDLDEVIMRTKIALEGREPFWSEEFEFSDSDDYRISGDSEDDLKIYLKSNAGRMSFAGGVVKKVGRGMMNLLENARKSELISFNDEELRKLRKMSVVVPDLDRRISHIQTFKQNVAKRQSFAMVRKEKVEEEEDDEDEDDEEEYVQVDTRKISIVVPKGDKGEMAVQMKRRQTGFVKAEDLEKIRVFQRKSISSDEDDDDDDDADTDRKVRIAPSKQAEAQSKLKRRPTAFIRPAEIPDDDGNDKETQMQKFLKKQAAAVKAAKAAESDGPGPTLKSYQPSAQQNILKGSKFAGEKPADVAEKSKYLRPSLTIEDNDVEQVLKAHAQKTSTKPAPGSERRASSLRTYEYGKSRPSMSVAEYQKRNQLLQNINAAQKPKLMVQVEKDAAVVHHKSLRLPGDSPLWSSDSTLSDVVSIFTTRRDPSVTENINKIPKEPTAIKLNEKVANI